MSTRTVELKYKIYKEKLVWTAKRKSRQIHQESMTDSIDFVVTWVDGSDPEWCTQKAHFRQALGQNVKTDDNEARYRNWDLFRYWFRAVEKYAPWVHNIYLITCGQVPEWLNIDAPKLKVICHTDYIPQEHLPTFNSNTIELNIHRISELEEHFVYFNDDVFLNRPVQPEDFFQGGKPNYTAVARPQKNTSFGVFEYILFTTLSVINNAFDQEVSHRIETHSEKWFAEIYGDYYIRCNLNAFDMNYLPGMLFPHLGVGYRKSTMKKVWDAVPERLWETSSNKFRTSQDVMHQIFSMWEMLEGEFNAVNKEYHGRVFSAQKEELFDIVDAIIHEKYRMICINDSEHCSFEEFLELREIIQKAFEQAFPQKSVYEK